MQNKATVRQVAVYKETFFPGDMKTCGRTFVTDGGNFYPKQIVHVPYNDDENKLESAFEDGIEKVDNKHCSSCILYFTENSK